MLTEFLIPLELSAISYLNMDDGLFAKNRADLHTTEHRLAQPGKLQPKCRQMNTSIRHKKAFFVYFCITGTVVIKSVHAIYTLGIANKYKDYSKLTSGIWKHDRLSKQMAAVMCKTSSVVCRSLFWAVFMLGFVLSARPISIHVIIDVTCSLIYVSKRGPII